jgi:ABC-type glycerol-3-phosphate transport system permease component
VYLSLKLSLKTQEVFSSLNPTVNFKQLFLALFFIGLSIGMILPYLFTLSISLKEESWVAMSFPPEMIPDNPTLKSFQYLLNETIFLRWTYNTIIVTLVATIAQIFFCSLAGYIFAKIEFKGRSFLFILLLSSMMVPPAVTLIPLFKIVQGLGWNNTYLALIVPNLAHPFAIFLVRQYISRISGEIMNAAKIDGCGIFRIYEYIMLPLIKPILATLVIIIVWMQWNNFIWPLIAVNTDEMRVLTVGLASLRLQNITNWSYVMAGSVLTILPILIIYIIFQRHFVEGITSGSVKG